MSYETAAPIISQMVDEATFKQHFAPPPAPAPPVPEPDAARRMALLIAYRDEYNANGGHVVLGTLAQRVGVPLAWAKICDRQVRAAIADVYATEIE